MEIQHRALRSREASAPVEAQRISDEWRTGRLAWLPLREVRAPDPVVRQGAINRALTGLAFLDVAGWFVRVSSAHSILARRVNRKSSLILHSSCNSRSIGVPSGYVRKRVNSLEVFVQTLAFKGGRPLLVEQELSGLRWMLSPSVYEELPTISSSVGK